jgi:hypothetical protein
MSGTPSPRGGASADADGLKLIASTGLYEPVAPVKGEQMWFLLGNAATPPELLPFDSIWADEGPPTHPGHLLFFDKLPPTSLAAAFEAELRKNPAFSAPTFTACAWLNCKITGTIVAISVSTLLRMRANSAGRPCVDGETPLILDRGAENLVFPDGALCMGYREDGKLAGITTTYAPRDQDPPPNGFGVLLPLAGAQSNLVGCVCFAGLINSLSGGNDPTRQRKSLWSVAIDPLHPIDTKRNYQRYSGQDFVLSGSEGAYRLDPA